MNITDELRKWASVEVPYKYGHQLCAIADRIDAEYQKAIRELNNLADASVLLPVDADGEIIHVGDMMERGEARGRVIALMLSKYPKKWGGGLHWGVQLEGEHAPTALDLTFHHYHAPTVEDVLTEMVAKVIERGELTNGAAQTIAEYAKRLTLAEGEDA